MSKSKTGTFNNPIVYFNVWWGGWSILSSFGLIGLDIPSIRTYLVIIFFIALYSVGCLLVMKKVDTKEIVMNMEMSVTIKRKLNFLYGIQLLILFVLIPFLIKSIPNIVGMEASAYRSAIFSTNILYASNSIEFVFDFFIQPMILTGLLLGALASLLGYKYRKLFFFSILNAVLYSIMTLGRWYFLRIILFVLLGYFLLKLTNKNKKNININVLKRNKRLLMSIFPVGVVAILISSVRGGENSILNTLYEYTIRYFTGSFIALDNFLNDYYENSMDYYFGRVTFAGLDEIIVFIIRRFDSNLENVKSSISFYTNDFISIGGGHTFNAFYTAIYNFFLDGGVLTLIVFTLLLGVTVGVAFNYYIRKPNLFSISVLVFLIYVSLIATLRWEFYYPMAWLVLLNLFLLITKINLVSKKTV